ncbi:unnamed protein product [Camellia sinensis]
MYIRSNSCLLFENIYLFIFIWLFSSTLHFYSFYFIFWAINEISLTFPKYVGVLLFSLILQVSPASLILIEELAYVVIDMLTRFILQIDKIFSGF